MENKIEQAIEILQQGGIIIFPTDTAFGIGCRVDDKKAIARLFKLRKRPETKATPVLVSNAEMAQNYTQPIAKEIQEKLINKYWPGALTIVLPCITEKIPLLVRGGGETIGLRMPNHPTTLALINGIGLPILGPSANFAGEKTPYTLQDIDKELIKQIDYLVPGQCTLKQASTVINCTTKPWKIERQGAIVLNNLGLT